MKNCELIFPSDGKSFSKGATRLQQSSISKKVREDAGIPGDTGRDQLVLPPEQHLFDKNKVHSIWLMVCALPNAKSKGLTLN